MLSRVAESIYWMSRQVERAENLARFLEVTLNLSLDQPDSPVDPWFSLIQITGDHEEFLERFPLASADTVTHFLAFDSDYGNSMLSSLRAARQNARGVRESLSSESFEQLNDFYHFVNDASKRPRLESPNEFFDAVRRIAIQWTGMLESTMPRDIAWHFANIGRLLERADKTSRILDVKYFNLLPNVDDVGTAIDDMQWSALLAAISAFESYRREHHLVEIPSVVQYFLFKEQFPRSILFCVSGAMRSLSRIEEMTEADRPGLAHEKTDALLHRLSNTSVNEVLAGGMHQFIDTLQTELNDIGDAMNLDYFHAATPV